MEAFSFQNNATSDRGTNENRESTVLWYQKPATTWSEALPVGNGRLGAMVYGRTSRELIQLNEDSVYYGGRQERTLRYSQRHLARLRRLIREGEHESAEELVNLAFIPMPACQRHYEPLATLKLDFQHDYSAVTNYIRLLDVEQAVASTQYDVDGVTWKRDLIASYDHDVLLLKITATQPSRFTVCLSRQGENEWDTNEFYDTLDALDGRLIMRFRPGGAGSVGASCVLAASCDPDGSIETAGGTLVVLASETYLVIAAHTEFRHANPTEAATADAEAALAIKVPEVFQSHVEASTRLLGGMRLGLNIPKGNSKIGLPTDERLEAIPDARLFELYHNFSRYLLVSSSRPWPSGAALSLPSNLQGIWNPSFSPPWGCRFTININTQMNNWPCHLWNLSPCSDPLFYLLERMAERGQKTAREVYGCTRPGAWCAHHNTDIWADTDPVDRWMPSALWPLGGAWLCLHIWERYQFEGDADLLGGQPFLERMFPVLEGAVAFLLGFLVEHANGEYLVTNPSLSPENSHYHTTPSGKTTKGALCEGSTMDISIVSAVLTAYLAALPHVLTSPTSLAAEAKATLARLPPLRISPLDGRLQEWLEPYPEPEPGHRHFSHLFSLYPGTTITPTGTPALAAACRATLSRRLGHGGAHTGWSRAWLICLYARLHDGEVCLHHLRLLLETSTQPNLIDTHPPMQVDGNSGASAGMLEMLVQSHEVLEGRRVVRVLPACPEEWLRDGGRLEGAKTRGGFELWFAWGGGGIVGEVKVVSQGRESAVLMLPQRRQVHIPRIRGTWVVEDDGVLLRGCWQ